MNGNLHFAAASVNTHEHYDLVHFPGKRAFSNEVGRCKRFFLRCWPPWDTPVRWILRAAIVGVGVFTPGAPICVAFIVVVLPTKHLFGHCGP